MYFVWRRRHALSTIPEPQPTTAENDQFATRAVAGAMALTILLLFVMLISSFITSLWFSPDERAAGSDDRCVRTSMVVEVQYPNEAEPYRVVTTANEIHVPVGTPIRIHGTSRDVIHSFWAPNIQGKRDLMPGYNTDVLMQVDKPGRWRGQCAEYCGLQHAHMLSSYIVAELQKDFEDWMTAQAQASVVPANAQAAHGQQVFLGHACVLCHTVRGTTAGSRFGPDLTHRRAVPP